MSVILFSLFHQFIVDFVGAAAGGVAPLRCRLAVEDAAVRIEDRDRRGALDLETKAFRYLGMANEIDVRHADVGIDEDVAVADGGEARSEERRVGKECVSSCRSWLVRCTSKK